jgi:hypothetical protein
MIWCHSGCKPFNEVWEEKQLDPYHITLYSTSEIFLNKLSECFVPELSVHDFFEAFNEHFLVLRKKWVCALVMLHMMLLVLYNQSKFACGILNIVEIESER